jgi:OFA family oxalate/formate antiporter-like MFS transporter
MLKTPAFFALWSCFIIGAIAGLMAIGISKPMGMGYIGLNKDDAANVIIAFAIPNGLGRPLFGWLTDKITPRYAAMLSFVLILVGSVGMLPAGNTSLGMSVRVVCFVFSFCCLWMCLGGWLAIAPTTTTTFFGPKNQPNNYGIVFSAYGIGAIAGNLLSGYVKDNFVDNIVNGKLVKANVHPDAYMLIFYVTLVLALIGMAIAFFAMKPPAIPGEKSPPSEPEKKPQKPSKKPDEDEDDDEEEDDAPEDRTEKSDGAAKGELADKKADGTSDDDSDEDEDDKDENDDNADKKDAGK